MKTVKRVMAEIYHVPIHYSFIVYYNGRFPWTEVYINDNHCFMGRNYQPSTLQDWKNLVLFYLSKRETSRPRLLNYLRRKFREYRLSEDQRSQVEQWFETILSDCERLNMINHERYADMLTREYTRRGKGARYVAGKLKEKGLNEEAKRLTVDPNEEQERALALAEKTLKRNTFQKLKDPRELKAKLFRALVTQGFDVPIASRAVELALKSRQI